MSHELRQLSIKELEIVENWGFKEEALLTFLRAMPKASQLLQVESLVFEREGILSFPTPVSPEGERVNPELADTAFRGRVGRHTVSAGLLMALLLDSLEETGSLRFEFAQAEYSATALTSHDIKKVDEIRLRKPFDSVDVAYNTAEEHLADFLKKSGLPEEYAILAGSLAHNGAKEFVEDPTNWPISRQCAYLADDLLQETKIQPDILAKLTRLKQDPIYTEVNYAGFPEMVERRHPKFISPDGSPRPKYDIQEEATTQMAKNVARVLGIDWQDLGKLLIQKATALDIYEAQVEPRTSAWAKYKEG